MFLVSLGDFEESVFLNLPQFIMTLYSYIVCGQKIDHFTTIINFCKRTRYVHGTLHSFIVKIFQTSPPLQDTNWNELYIQKKHPKRAQIRNFLSLFSALCNNFPFQYCLVNRRFSTQAPVSAWIVANLDIFFNKKNIYIESYRDVPLGYCTSWGQHVNCNLHFSILLGMFATFLQHFYFLITKIALLSPDIFKYTHICRYILISLKYRINIVAKYFSLNTYICGICCWCCIYPILYLQFWSFMEPNIQSHKLMILV